MNQKIVQQKAHQLLGNDIDLTRKNKKYMVLNVARQKIYTPTYLSYFLLWS